jgi:hypothetical protein
MQNEDPPSGRQWHADLINHAGRETGNRPAILPPALVHAAGRTRKFRHVCAHAYDTFDPDDADPAVRAAEKLAGGLAEAVTAYRKAIAP